MVLRKYELEAKLKDEHQLISSGVLREENPLDLSDEFNQFLEACRRGDLKRCHELMAAGVNINGKDTFDYTPLIIASLCGHFELVRLLLESGALAERNTFQGERCIYNALNDRIRNLLLQYDYSKSTDPLQPWSSHITSLLSRDTPSTSDIAITAASQSFHLHKLLLASRTPYFRSKLSTSPDLSSWKLPPAIPVESFHVVLNYLYLGELPRDLVDPRSSTSEEEVFKGIDKLCKYLEIEKLWEAVLSVNDRRLARQRYQDEVERAQQQVEAFFRETVLRHRMVVDTRKVDEIRWPHDNAMFADCILRADEADGEDDDVQEPPPPLDGLPLGPLSSSFTPVPNGKRKQARRSVLYPAHKAFLIRSPYFEVMFSSQFLEAQETEHLRIIKVDCAPEVLEIILTFLYTEKADCPLEFALDLLYVSDMLFLDKLKTKAAVTISTLGSGNSNILVDRTHTGAAARNGDGGPSEPGGGSGGEVEMEPINVYDVLHAAWDLKVQRLEEFCARYIAYRLEDYIDDPDFAELISESASRLQRREETDTIELLDDIRYYLSERFRLRFEDAGLEEIMEEEEDVQVEDQALQAQLDVNGLLPPEVRLGEVKLGGGAGEASGGEQAATAPAGGVMRTLDGELVDDEFSADAVNYQILLQKIDVMLDKLKLDA